MTRGTALRYPSRPTQAPGAARLLYRVRVSLDVHAEVSSIGVEAHPMAHFASMVKVDWTPDADGLLQHARIIGSAARDKLTTQGINDDLNYSSGLNGRQPVMGLPANIERLLVIDSISPMPLHKTLILRESIANLHSKHYVSHELLALAKAAVHSASNLRFSSEVGAGKRKPDAQVIEPWLHIVEGIAADLRILSDSHTTPSTVKNGDARQIDRLLEPQSVDAVITSPPYPNEKDYTRATRLESVLLGFLNSRDDLRRLKEGLVRSNTRNVFKDDQDDAWLITQPKIDQLAQEIERRRTNLEKTSGFEKLYGRVTRLYFGGMARHLASLRAVLRPGAQYRPS